MLILCMSSTPDFNALQLLEYNILCIREMVPDKTKLMPWKWRDLLPLLCSETHQQLALSPPVDSPKRMHISKR